jgi:hypothetical protein
VHQTGWTGLRWTAGPIDVPQNGNLQVSLGGWSRGYVVFRMIDVPPTNGFAETISVVPSESSDGVHWKSGAAMDVSGLDISEWVGDVVEGPAGLLASGYMQGVACGGPAPVNAIWLSSDGLSWRRTALSGFGGGKAYRIAAGSSGYIATGVGPGTKPAPYVWTSKDGITWVGTNVESATVKGVEVTNAASFAGGFVLAGAAPDPKGMCGAGTLTPSLWWSTNGKAWSRDTITGTTPGDNASFNVYRISDHALLAQESSYSLSSNVVTHAAWASTDGRTWTKCTDPAFAGTAVLSYGAKGILMSIPVDAPIHLDFWDIRSDFTAVKLVQSGSGPTGGTELASLAALGPIGVVVANADGSQFWVGTPTVS